LNPLSPYPGPEAREASLQAAAARSQGDLVRYGRSVEGRALLALRLPQLGRTERAPFRVLVSAGIHGPEYVSTAVVLALIERVDADPGLIRLRRRAELWAIPCLNPDGYARVWERAGRGGLSELRPNARGVDLNRNFPLPSGWRRRALPGAGSSRPGAATYVGPGPLSEPETAALARLMAEKRFVASTNGHCFMGRLIPAHVKDARSALIYRDLCRAFARAQLRTRYGRLASRHLDTFTGEMEDYQHHHHGTWAVCVETFPWWASFRQHLRAPSLFWRFNPRDPARWIDNDVPGIAAFLHAALDLSAPP
jgi:hypothetical protein